MDTVKINPREVLAAKVAGGYLKRARELAEKATDSYGYLSAVVLTRDAERSADGASNVDYARICTEASELRIAIGHRLEVRRG